MWSALSAYASSSVSISSLQSQPPAPADSTSSLPSASKPDVSTPAGVDNDSLDGSASGQLPASVSTPEAGTATSSTTPPASGASTPTKATQRKSRAFLDLAPLDTFAVRVANTGNATSDYVALLFVSGAFGPAPHPNKQLVAYTRLHDLAPGQSAIAELSVTLGAIARADESGAKWVYPGTYMLALDTTGALRRTFELVGEARKIADWPKDTGASAGA